MDAPFVCRNELARPDPSLREEGLLGMTGVWLCLSNTAKSSSPTTRDRRAILISVLSNLVLFLRQTSTQRQFYSLHGLGQLACRVMVGGVEGNVTDHLQCVANMVVHLLQRRDLLHHRDFFRLANQFFSVVHFERQHKEGDEETQNEVV